MKNSKTILAGLMMMAFITLIAIQGCKKENSAASVTAPKVFKGIGFNTTSNAYFSTDGSMVKPVNETQAKTMASKIDFRYIFYFSDAEPGFIDPKTCAQHNYWDEYYSTWSGASVQTIFYGTNITKAQFDEAALDQSKIGTYLSDVANATPAPHAIFPAGSCIGGRVSSGPSSLTIRKGKVFGFKNVVSGKRGLLYISTQQAQDWPMPILDNATSVDIIREN